MTNSKSGSGGKLLAVLLVLALGALVIVLAVQSRSIGRTVAELRAKIAEQAKATKDLRDQTEVLAIEKYEKKLDVRSRDSQLADVRARVEELDAEVSDLAAKLEAARTERDEHLAARLDLARRLEGMKTELAVESRRHSGLSDRLEASEVAVARLEKNQDALAEAKKQLEGRVTSLMDELRSREDAFDRLQDELGAALGKAVDLKREVARAQAAREEMSRRLLEVLAQLKEQEIPEGSGVDR